MREVGTLCHGLPGGGVVTDAGHREHAQALWKLPAGRIRAKPGYHTVELFRRFGTATAAGGDIHTVWVQVSNPAQSLPNRGALIDPSRALGDKFLIASDVYPTETTRMAMPETRIGFFAHPDLARRHRRGIPKSLDGAPMLLPTPNTSLRRMLDGWFEARGIRPQVVGEFEDTALLKAFGMQAYGIFVAPAVLEAELRRSYGVVRLGDAEGVRESYYAITIERRIACIRLDEVKDGDSFKEKILRQGKLLYQKGGASIGT